MNPKPMAGAGKSIRLAILGGVAAALVLVFWIGVRTWPRPLRVSVGRHLPVEVAQGKLVFPFPAKSVLGEVGSFDNELSAYLWFDYVRSRPAMKQSQVLLTATERLSKPIYRIYVVLPNDAVEAIAYLANLEAKKLIIGDGDHLVYSNPAAIEYDREQTALFLAAYNKPVQRNLNAFTAKQLVPSVARFLIFKSRTDPRVLGGADVRSLSREQATELAADIIAVSKFYDLPLDIFLGIGAMENNYLSIRGDLKHAVWKKRAAKDDIILKRRGHRVLVSDYSIGVWQITRETLRYAHDLYLKDKRDYSQLPTRLRPPKSLELDLTNSHVLTTYAGLLLRDLLDRFQGDVAKAIGAYNGGFRNPNLRYAAGVQKVAEYARNILERVTAINGRAIARTTLFIRRAGP
jgi:hypothetical protein